MIGVSRASSQYPVTNPHKPIRFQHIGLTAQTSLTSLLKLLALRDLRQTLESLDTDITSMRDTINPPDSPLRGIDGTSSSQPMGDKGKYEDVEDVGKLERLVKAKERTKASLEDKIGWVGLEQARAEEMAEKAPTLVQS